VVIFYVSELLTNLNTRGPNKPIPERQKNLYPSIYLARRRSALLTCAAPDGAGDPAIGPGFLAEGIRERKKKIISEKILLKKFVRICFRGGERQ